LQMSWPLVRVEGLISLVDLISSYPGGTVT
jgi:hypothetical protein